MRDYQSFVFRSYHFDTTRKTLELHYGLDDQIDFVETYTFDFDFAPAYDEEALDRACKLLFFMAGVSYYKTYLPPTILSPTIQLSKPEAAFVAKTWQKGLGEFFYINNLDPKTEIEIPGNGEILNTLSIEGRGQLVAIGGGKDSLVSVDLLRDQSDIATWSVGHAQQLAPLTSQLGLPHLSISRTWDKSLLKHNQQGALNGHVPISAILACVGMVAAILSGKQDVVMSNERSANEPTLSYRGVSVNHQYSKSLEFEQDFQTILRQHFGESLQYYSLLRPLSELRISELFAPLFDTYRDVFSSCNKAYVHTSNHLSWCSECPKCAFVFLALTPFVEQTKLETLFGKNLLLDPSLDTTYKELLGIEGDKPLECIGEILENRSAMRLAQEIYPELSKYKFDIPETYDFRSVEAHAIPEEVWLKIQGALRQP